MSRGLVLAIDTTTESGSLALADGSTVLALAPLTAADGYGHVLFDEVTRLLAANGVTLNQIALFAAAAGPGTFTGIRVGLAAAKGLAAALGRPAAGVSNLQALAHFGEGPRRAAVLDARRGEIYGAVYGGDSLLQGREGVLPFAQWLAGLDEEPSSFVFLDPAPFAAELDASRFAAIPRIAAGPLLAGAVALLAWPLAADPALLDANYVRRSDAEMAWSDRG